MRQVIYLNRFKGLPYRNVDILHADKVTSESEPSQLERAVSLDGRDYLDHVKLKNGKELFVKPYVSDEERSVIARLKGLEISSVLDFDNDYFVEERIRIPSIESALESKATFLDLVAGLFGKALYLMHSRGVRYNGIFDHHVFVDELTGKIKISDFSRAQLTLKPVELHEDIVQALRYMEHLAQRYEIPKKDFKEAVSRFKENYAIDELSRRVFLIAETQLLYVESSPLMAKAIKRCSDQKV